MNKKGGILGILVISIIIVIVASMSSSSNETFDVDMTRTHGSISTALGSPILGDPFYGTPDSQEATRLMLHSHRLRLRHPDGGEMMDFRAKLPF